MKLHKKLSLSGFAAALMLVGCVGITSGTASADEVSITPYVCDSGGSGTQYRTTQSVKYIGNPSTRIFGSPGGTLTIAKGKSTTVSGSLQTTASAEAGIVFAKASVSVGVTIGMSKTVTTTTSYSWKVPANQNPGWIELGSAGYQISWTKGYYASPCTWHQTGSGTALGATSNQYFSHS